MGLDLKVAKQYFFALCIIGFIMITRNVAAAEDSSSSGTDAITQVLCNVVNLLQGTVGQAIATIAIIVLGIGLFIGKLSWPVALATAVGVGIIFGATNLVEWLSPGTISDACSGSN